MIHYINGKPAKNIRLNKTKRHAVAHYRHEQRMTIIKDTLARLTIALTLIAVLTITLLSSTTA